MAVLSGCTESGDGGGLQPVDAGRLVARLVLKADAQEVAGFEHLPRCLREAPRHGQGRIDAMPGR